MFQLRLTIFLLSCFYVVSNNVGYVNSSNRDYQLVKIPMNQQERTLIEKLLKGYDKNQKPVGTTGVKFALNLNQIVKVIAKEQIFMLNVFLDHEWRDKRLSWNPAENGNITILRIDSARIWTPDSFVYNTADKSGFLLPQKGAYFVVNSDGLLFWPNPLPQMKVRCEMGISWFPYDDQICTIVFGSWSNTQSYLNYTLMNQDTALVGYQPNSEWELVEYKGFRYEIKYDNWIEEDAFSEIHYQILIRRKPLFVLQNYALPAVMLGIITLSTFYMPFAQEMQLGIAIMLTFSILKLKLSDDIPAQSDTIPLFNVYFTACMFSALVSMFWFQQHNVLRTRNMKIPKWIRSFVLKFVCPVFRVRDYVEIENKDNDQKTVGREELNDKQVLDILNDFIFGIFLIYFLSLNFFLLVIFPMFFKTPLVIKR